MFMQKTAQITWTHEVQKRVYAKLFALVKSMLKTNTGKKNSTTKFILSSFAISESIMAEF